MYTYDLNCLNSNPQAHISAPPNSFQNTHKAQRISIYPSHIISFISLLKEFFPRFNRPFLRIEQSHHSQIRRRSKTRNTPGKFCLAWTLFTNVVNENYTRAWLECGDERAQNSDRLDVGPVVEDPFEHVDIGLDGLGVEEVVCAERYAVAQVLGEFFFENRGDFGKVLDDDFEVGEFACEDCVVVAC